MDNIYLDDWNKIFNTPPACITENSVRILQQAIPYHDDRKYMDFKQSIRDRLLAMGDYEAVAFISGSQAVERAVIIAKQQYLCKKLFKMKTIYHGMNVQQWEEGETGVCGLEINEIIITQDGEINLEMLSCEKNAIILIEPLLIFARYGKDKMQDILQKIQQTAQENRHIVIVDEVRSGVFKTGFFLLSETVSGFKPAIICLSKGMALAVAISACCFDKNLFPAKLLKKNDIVKSNLSLSALALQRAVDLLNYAETNKEWFFRNSSRIEYAVEQHRNRLADFKDCISVMHISGCTCVLVFNPGIPASKLRSVRMFLLASKIVIRHFEENLLYLNFALDTGIDQVDFIILKIFDAVSLIK